MKIKSSIVSVSVFIIIILSSCATAYVPNVVNAPLLTNRGEVQVSVNTGIAGFDPQIAVAVSDHIGLMVNGSFASRTSDTTNNYHKHQFIEAGAGYYRPFGAIGKLEFFAGAGTGKVNANYENSYWVSRSDVSFTRLFIQPTIGFTTKVFDGGFTSRIVMLDMHQASGRSVGYFIEPAFTGKIGYKQIKTVFQIGFSVPFNDQNIKFNYQPFIMSVGLQGNFGKVFR
jgi:hypothetical protein